jgi:hypothetical protein
LSDASVPQGAVGTPISVADSGFCEELAEYLGIKPSTAKTAFLDEPAQRALSVASWAMDKSEDPEERARMVIAWAKKRRAGAFRPKPDEYISLAGSGAVGRKPPTARTKRSPGSLRGTGTRTRDDSRECWRSWRSG